MVQNLQDEIKIAIILTCYRSDDIVERALSRINEQTKKQNIVLYFINNNSPYTKDKYLSLLQKYSSLNIKYFETDMSIGSVRNFGLQQVQEKYLIFHDDDDYLYDEYVIENYINTIKENDSFSFIRCAYLIKNDEFEREVFALSNSNYLCRLYNKDFLDKYNLKFNDNLKQCEDFLFFNQVNYYAGIDNLRTIDVSFFNYVIYHMLKTPSLTNSLEDEEEQENIFQLHKGRFVYEIIYFAELIKFYKQQKQLFNENKKLIILILKNIYMSSLFILIYLENQPNLLDKFSKEELELCYSSWIFLLDLIEKNYLKVYLKPEIDYAGPTNYVELSFIYFRDSFDERWKNLTKM